MLVTDEELHEGVSPNIRDSVTIQTELGKEEDEKIHEI